MSDVPPSLRGKKKPRRFDFSWMGSIAGRIRNALGAHTAEENEALRRQSDVAWRESLSRLSQRPQNHYQSKDSSAADELPGMFDPNSVEDNDVGSDDTPKGILEDGVMSEEDLDALYAAEVDADDVDADDFDDDDVDFDPEFADVDADTNADMDAESCESENEENIAVLKSSASHDLDTNGHENENADDFDEVDDEVDDDDNDEVDEIDVDAVEIGESDDSSEFQPISGTKADHHVESPEVCQPNSEAEIEKTVESNATETKNTTDDPKSNFHSTDSTSLVADHSDHAMEVDEEPLTKPVASNDEQSEKKSSFFSLNRSKLVGFFFGPNESANDQEESTEAKTEDVATNNNDTNEASAVVEFGQSGASDNNSGENLVAHDPAANSPAIENSAEVTDSVSASSTEPEVPTASVNTHNICWNLFNVGFSVAADPSSTAADEQEPAGDASFSYHELSYDYSFDQYTPVYSQDAADQEFNVLSQTAYRLISSSALFGGAPAPPKKRKEPKSMPAPPPKENTEEIISKNIRSAQALFSGSSLFGGKRKRDSESSEDSFDTPMSDSNQDSSKKSRPSKKPRSRTGIAIPGRQPHMTRRALRILEAEREKEASKANEPRQIEENSPARKRRARE